MSPLLLRRLGLSLLLLVFAFYAVFLTPGYEGPAAWSGRYGSERNPAVLTVFGLLIVATLMYWAQLSTDSRRQKIWAWPFALAMIAAGAFSLLAYLILRDAPTISVRKPTGLVFRVIESRGFANLMLVAILGLLAWAIGQGDGLGFIREFRTSGLVNIVSVNLVLLILLFPVLLTDDFAHRGLNEESPLARIAMSVPLLGPALYLALRPDEASSPPTKTTSRRH